MAGVFNIQDIATWSHVTAGGGRADSKMRLHYSRATALLELEVG
jgi:hypothetical protein